jgi:hypothetical protein
MNYSFLVWTNKDAELSLQAFRGRWGKPFFVRKLFQAASITSRTAKNWYLLTSCCPPPSTNTWDTAHDLRDDLRRSISTETYVEPDVLDRWRYRDYGRPIQTCTGGGSDFDFPIPVQFDSYLDLTQLREARAAVPKPNGRPIRVVHLDTGWDPNHVTRPNVTLQRNFIEGGDNASDNPIYQGIFPLQFGHGTGAIGILAGGSLAKVRPKEIRRDEPLGGAPDVDVVPVRISECVLLTQMSPFIEGELRD